jgi:hypothetical protein
MKKSKLLFAVILMIAAGLNSCEKDKSTTDPSGSSTSEIVGQGNWVITLFNDSGNEETQNFAGYTFTFNSNGTITAVKDASTVNGTWNTETDDSNNKLIMDFGTTVPFSELNEDWLILEKSSVRIRLEHVSGGNGGTDLLTFEKN